MQIKSDFFLRSKMIITRRFIKNKLFKIQVNEKLNKKKEDDCQFQKYLQF